MILRPAIVVLGWLAGTWLLWSIPRVRAAASGTVEAVEAVSVVIPARDEAATLPGLLASLAGQHPAPAEILVVDDHSTDDGAEVARRAGATVVPAPPLPAGWTGKCWACWTGARAAGGSVLVFLDADTELDPGGLAPIVAEQAGRGGLVSVQPFHRTRRPYEALSAFLNIVPWMGLAAATPTAARRWSPGAFGPCLVTTRADYRAIGGHEAVRGEVVEDVALAARYRAAGLPVATLGGRGTISFRMYPGGVSQLVEGWTKNIAGGAGASRPGAMALAVLWVAGCISAAAGLANAAADLANAAASAAAYAAYAAQIAWMLARLGRFPWWTAAAFPVPLAFFLAVFARSLVLTKVSGEVRWRGRAVSTKPR